MTAKIEIRGGSEAVEIAAARFEAWLVIERDREKQQIEEDVSDINRERERLNALSQAEKEKWNTERVKTGKKPVSWPLKPIVAPAWNDSMLSRRRVKIARKACTMTKAECDALRAEFGTKCDSMNSEDFQDVQDALGVWGNGEEKRAREARIEAARQTALQIIAKRKSCPDDEKVNYADCFCSFGPEGGGFHGGSEWRPQIWDKLSAKEQEPFRKQWERVERLLPVYYEYARQSVTLLQLAVMRGEIEKELPEAKRAPKRESSKPRLGGCMMHPLDFTLRRRIEALHSRIGGYAEAVIKSLGEFLVQDMPYPLIPLNRRKWAASFVMSVNEDHHIMGPMLTDAGPVLDPWVIGQVQRDTVRLARNEEATQKAEILYRAIINTEQTKGAMSHEHVIEFDKAIRATTSDQSAVNKRTKKKGHYRAFDNDGSEVLALKITWHDTLDSKLAEAFLKLIKWMRPRKTVDQRRYQFVPEVDWPERPARKKRGSKWEKEAKAALDALIAHLKKQAAHNAWRAAKDEAARLRRELKRGRWTAKEQSKIEADIQSAAAKESKMGGLSKRLTLPGKKLGVMTACFEKIVGGDEVPWWKKSAKSK